MELYLLRHGLAADLGEGGVTRDADRPLTEEGWDKMRDQAKGMRKLGLKFEYIFTSPYWRTRQTAQAVAEVYDFDEDRIILVEALAAGRPFALTLHRKAEVFIDIGAYHFERALIVGHQPDMTEMASVLLTGMNDVNIEFKKGSLCAIQVANLPPRTTGTLLWSMTPKQLRLLARS